jgi:molybdate/tungstate transport system substrate-binding protein
MKYKLFFWMVLIITFLLPGCAAKPKTPLVVFAAGSLIKPFADLEKAFEAKYPSVDVQAEYHGSIQVIRQTTDLHQKIDVIATADQSLIPSLMYTQRDPDTGKPFADWYIRFATNSLGIAYAPKSKYADEISDQNWAEILARPDVKVGIADPRFDASGYRALMVYKLVENQTGKTDLFSNMFENQFRMPFAVDEGGGYSVIRVPEIVESVDSSHIIIRGASVQLLALLESGDLDYAFEYDSVIKQHGLKLLHLPDELNLSNSNMNETYGKVTVLLDFKRFASVKPEFTGEQIGYGITIPTNAVHPEEAALFINFLLGPDGRKIMEENFQNVFDPVIVDQPANLPGGLKSFAKSQ